jgi:hypothetical protein
MYALQTIFQYRMNKIQNIWASHYCLRDRESTVDRSYDRRYIIMSVKYAHVDFNDYIPIRRDIRTIRYHNIMAYLHNK